MIPADEDVRWAEATSASARPLGAVNLLVRLCGVLSTLLILAAICLTSYAIVQRYVMGAPLLWGDELTGYGLVAMVMLGAAEAYRRGDHISIDLVATRVGPRIARVLTIWADLSVLAFAIVLGWSAWKSITFAYGFGSYSSGHIEIATWIPQIPMLIAAVLFGLTAIVRLADQFTADCRR